MAAVELAAGNQVQRGDEQADPAGDKHRVRRDVVERWERGVPMQSEGVEQADGERFAAETNDSLRRDGMGVMAEREAHAHGHGRSDIAGQRTVDAHIHERVAVGNADRNLNDRARRAAERGCGQHPGQRGADAVPAAGKVMAELVDEQNAEQRCREDPTRS